MDRTEEHVSQYLATRFAPNEVVYEPDGRVLPDFAIGGEIAVEARRLNQHYESGGQHEALEAKSYPLLGFMLREMQRCGPPDERGSWFISYDYSRPLPPWKKLRAEDLGPV
jgi:hypothetical protein